MKKRASEVVKVKKVARVGRPEVIGGGKAGERVARETEGDAVLLEEEEREREAAFSFEPVWKGRAVNFSISKEGLFLQLRKAMGAPGLYECLADGEAFFADALRIVYLGTHGAAELGAARGDMMKLQELVDAWADGAVERGEQMAVTVLGIQVWNASQVNAAEVVVEEDPRGRKGDGPGN